MNKRIVLVFDLDEPDSMSEEQLSKLASELGEFVVHFIGYEGWRVEDDA
jgi:hypothetical protein